MTTLRVTMDDVALQLVEAGIDPDTISSVECLMVLNLDIDNTSHSYVMTESIKNLTEREVILKQMARLCAIGVYSESEIIAEIRKEKKNTNNANVTDYSESFDKDSYKSYKAPSAIAMDMKDLVKDIPITEEPLNMEEQLRNMFAQYDKKDDNSEDNTDNKEEGKEGE